MKKILIIVLVIAVLLGFYVWSSYNNFIKAGEGVDGQWAQVESQYQRRFDLIPNLVSSVKGAMGQEQKVFGDLADARTRYSGAGSVGEKVAAANEVESALGRLLVIMENYPQLKSVEAVQTLMVQLEGTENRISVERGRYNDAVKGFNVMVKRFPSSLIASVFGFSEKDYFESANGAENAPNVSF
jgi:LemA protein